jgi:catechol 2,3-dioxygenase-like lactoylglutathione lyase family enzyme
MNDPKSMARRLRADLAARDVSIGHSEALEIVAHQHGVRDWNTLAARSAPDESSESAAVPILRIFDRAKAVEFYVDYLGFHLDWEHGGPDLHTPVYAQVSRGRAVLHLSEHHGDASPGGAALIPVTDVAALHDELHTRTYDYAHPGIRDEEWGRVMVVIDPFHNRIVFHQPVVTDIEPRPAEASAPIDLSYELDATPDEAFAAFTGRIDEWWHPAYAPPDLERVEIEPHEGGRALMHLADGTTYHWGTVTVWRPPFEYAQTFALAQDPEHPSTLQVQLESTRARGRRHPGSIVRFAHGGWTSANVADRARFTEWGILLDRFAAVADGRPLPEVPAFVTEGGSPG